MSFKTSNVAMTFSVTLLHNILFTERFPRPYCSEDLENIIRDYFELFQGYPYMSFLKYNKFF